MTLRDLCPSITQYRALRLDPGVNMLGNGDCLSHLGLLEQKCHRLDDFFSFWAVLELELRTLHLLGRRSST
jgi:hypothetical protein